MSTTQGKQPTATAQICQTIDKMSAGFSESLQGTGIAVGRFVATAKMAVQTHADKSRLEAADRGSLFLAIKKAAGDGLMPDNREAALVIYGNQVQYQPMVQGLVKLARNSGEIESINSEVVYENDEFELYHDFDGVQFKHLPNWKEDRGQPILVWAAVKLKSGERIARAYPKSRIMQIATRSKMGSNYDPLKGKDWEEFWRKAAIRNILKYAPKSTALEKALDTDSKEFDYSDEVVEHDAPKAAPANPSTANPSTAKRETKASTVVKQAAAPEPTITPDGEVIDAEFSDTGSAVDDRSTDEELPI